jgi:hypothetical protein
MKITFRDESGGDFFGFLSPLYLFIRRNKDFCSGDKNRGLPKHATKVVSVVKDWVQVFAQNEMITMTILDWLFQTKSYFFFIAKI